MISVVHPFSYVDHLKQIDRSKRMVFPALISSGDKRSYHYLAQLKYFTFLLLAKLLVAFHH